MDEKNIYYTKGYKYQLKEDYGCHIDIKPFPSITTEYIDLLSNGRLIIRKGYAWDGPSGPTIDTKTFMRGSLIHDALYQLMREGHLQPIRREQADIELKKACLEDDMMDLRAWYVYRSVHRFASFASSPKNIKKVIVAPGVKNEQ